MSVFVSALCCLSLSLSLSSSLSSSVSLCQPRPRRSVCLKRFSNERKKGLKQLAPKKENEEETDKLNKELSFSNLQSVY